MRFVRVRHAGLDYFGSLLDDDTVQLWTAAPFGGGTITDRLVPLRKAQLLAPLLPSKVLCVGRNYRAHAKELGNDVPSEPLLFLKPPSAIIAHGEPIVLPPESARVEHEGELGIVIGRRLRRASAAEALSSVFGYTCVNDVTARDLQRKDVQFTRGKGFDTFCPVGPHIETDVTPLALTITTRVNGETRQAGNTADMIWPVGELLAFMSQVMTLEPGDLVSTGTPEGVGPLHAGDHVSVEVASVGKLENPVTAASA